MKVRFSTILTRGFLFSRARRFDRKFRNKKDSIKESLWDQGIISTTIGVIAIIVSCYVIIWISFQRRRRQNLGDLTDQEKEKALAVTLLLVSGGFMVTWSPPMLYLAITRVCSNCIQPSRKGLGWVFLLFAVQSLINPIIYCFRLPMFKMSLKAVVKRIYLKGFRRSACTPVRKSAIHPETQVKTGA